MTQTFVPLRNVNRLGCLALLAFLALDAKSQGNGRQRAFHKRETGSTLESPTECSLTSGGESTVLNVAGPQTLHLADGRFVRLAEVLVPVSSFAATGFDPAAAAVEHLRKTIVGHRVVVKFGGTQRDRYGVFIAHIFAEGPDAGWVQEQLVKLGVAQVHPSSENHACAKTLYRFEEEARVGRTGHWGLALFKIYPASDPKGLLNVVQTFQTVEGVVTSANEKSGRLFLHFGPDETKDFAVTAESQIKKKLLTMKSMDEWKGTRLRVRGWLDRRRGPTLPVVETDQIEVLPSPMPDR